MRQERKAADRKRESETEREMCMLLPDMLLKLNYSDKVKEDQTARRSNREPKDQRDKSDDKEIS